ncbi:MAG TPA: hypothetical protein VGY55_13180, partial [Pirellulales bacterium]|nr:hypothetical protein [Pirellulales bacterium]
MAAITKTDVVGWLRVQARKHRKAAEVLEGAADEVERAELGEQGEQKADTLHEGYDIGIESPNSGPSVADVRKYLGNGSKRKPEIAANFGVADI